MSFADKFWIVMFIASVVGTIVAHLVERRRQSITEFEKHRRDRKQEVERAARKTL